MKYLYIHLIHIAWRVWTGIFLSGFPPTTSAVSDQTSPYLSLNTKTDSFIVSSSGTEYILVSGVSVTQSDAASWCRTHEKAGHLVTLENKSELGGVFSGLLQINKKNLQGDVWIQGTTGSPVIEFSPTEDPTGADKPGGLHFEDIIIDGHKTTRCVVINISGNVGSRRKGVLSLKRRTCHSINVPPFKYLVAQGVGKCPYGSKAAIAGNIYMSASNCTSLGGVHDTRDSGHQISICTLDWCAVQSPTGGWAFALNGLCASKRYFTAGVKSNHGMCYATRGEYDHTGFANSPVCWMQLCFLGETPPTRDSIAVVGSMNCPIDQKYGSVSIYAVTDQCFRAGEEIFGQLSSIYTEREWVKCLFKTCRLGKDCKTTERGREYRGSLDSTISGKKCQYWSDQEPHRHANTNPDWYPDKTLSDARNYCRNPGDWVEGPYCYTTDPKVTWEICDLPFCQGSGPETTSFDIGESTYIVIPGLHNNPSKYCRERFGASLAFIQDKYELEKISEHLMNLIEKGDLKPDTAEIWVAGKTRLLPDVLVEDFNSVINEDWPQNCILLSRWNSSALIYNNREFQLYSSKCQIYMRNFLCEVVEVRIPNYELYGGKLQRNITSELDCKVSCVPPCTGIDYNVRSNRCYFVYGEDVCRPGRKNNEVVHYRKKNCECNRFLVTSSDGIEDDKITASSVYNGTTWNEIHSPSRARLNSEELITPEGTLASAWVADTNDVETPWIQVEFPTLREVFGTVMAGREGRGAWVSKFFVTYSEDCETFQFLKDGVGTVLVVRSVKYFNANHNSQDTVTVTFPWFIRAKCVRIHPRDWQEMVAMKFDLLGCISSRRNLALRKPAQSSSVFDGNFASRAVDGYNQGTHYWNKCTHTTPGMTNNWWMVNLEATYRITEVLITNREDCCKDRLVGAQVHITKTFLSSLAEQRMLDSTSRCGIVNYVPIMRREIPVVRSEGIVGRHVVIISSRRKILSLCEVKVYGEKVETINYALRKQSHQSSTKHQGYATNAVDGNHNTKFRSGSCSHTTSENKPWWAVDLGFQVKVESVLITNRADCCAERLRNFNILVGDTVQDTLPRMHKCAYIEHNLDAGETRHIICDKPVSGRIVKIQHDFSDPLTLCEVEVFGERATILTFGGTSRGAPCKFPFIDENGQSHENCIFESRRHDWCATSSNGTSEWGYCQDVRLLGGRYAGEGRVEVRRNVTWGGVCDDGWNDVNSRVACQQLGYQDGRAIFPPYFPTGTSDVFISEVMCRGNETGLVDCDYMDGTWHACSTHEDAGVQCYNPEDIIFYNGAPAIARRYTEEWWSGVILLPSPDIIPYHGRIIAWEVYAVAPVAPSDILTLQVWRFLGDDNFVLIGSNDIVIPSKGYVHAEVVLENQIAVMPGDVLGIKFLQNNPVPFDYSFSCVDDTLYYFQNTSDLSIGDVVRFQSKTLRNRCKLYSVSAKLKKDESRYLPDFSRGSSVYLILPDSPLPKVDAEVKCVLNLGINSTVLRISNSKEYREVNRELLERSLFGEFWIENVRSDVINMTNSDWLQWARCDPDPGKNCLALSRESNLEQNFMWKTTSCEKTHLVICERNDGIEEEDEEFEIIPIYPDYQDNSTYSSIQAEEQRMTVKKTASTAVVLTIIALVLIAFAVVAIFVYKRYRNNRPIYSHLNSPTYKSEDDVVHLGGEMDNQFNNPMYDVNNDSDNVPEDSTETKNEDDK